VKKNLRNFITTSFLALFLGYFALITLFSHPHVIDGKISLHAHPFQKSNPNHTHTKAEFLFYQYSSSIETEQFCFDFELKTFFVTVDIHYIPIIDQEFLSLIEITSSGLRGPPNCC
jgi:hypothetical protein